MKLGDILLLPHTKLAAIEVSVLKLRIVHQIRPHYILKRESHPHKERASDA